MVKTVESLAQLHELELEAMLEIDRVCAKHGIRWFLHGGTLLGGIREGGPLAWDDDVDIAMLKDDFERFIQIAPRELDSRFALTLPGDYDEFFDFLPRVSDLEWKYEATREDANAFDGRLDHPDVDIFVLEPSCAGFADTRQSLSLLANYAQALGHRPHVDHSEFSGVAKLASYVLPAIGKHRSMKRLLAARKRIANRGTNVHMLRIINELPRYAHLRWDANWYTPDVKRTVSFSGVDLPVPAGAEDVLELVYGKDWRIPPPQAARVPQHASLQ